MSLRPDRAAALAPAFGPRSASPDRAAQEARLAEAWRIPTGWRYWSAVNNTVVGQWYIVVTLLFFLFGGVLALVMRLQLAVADNTLVSADRYNQIFTVHGSVMMFLFAIPIFEAVSIALLPAILGARELPFPRLSAFGFWAFAIGGAFLCGALFFDAAPKGGWFMYPPLTSGYQPDIGADIWLLGFSFIEVAAIAAAVELIVGVLRSRPPGMGLHLMPLYAWYVLVAAAMVLFAFPPLIAGTAMLELERALGWPFFDPRGGGDPLLWQHLFWIFGHPEVYIIFLPSVALLAMIVPTAARHRLVGYRWVVLSALGTGFLSFGLWVHHMFTTGLPALTLAIFSAASAAVAVPTTVQFLCFAATMLAGQVRRSVPMLYVAGGIATFAIGGLTGVMVAMAPFNLQAHDSFFVVAHLHTVLIGGAVFPMLAGLYYYFPIVGHACLSERLGRWGFWLVFVGVNLTFQPMHALGLLGMPRRVFTYASGVGWDALNLVATAGAFVLAAGIVVVTWDVVRPKKGAAEAPPRNPWGAGTLEWLPPIPNPSWGLRAIPAIQTRYPLWDQPGLAADYDAGHGYLPDAEEGRREMLVTSTVDAEPQQCLRIPGPTFITLAAAVAVGAMFVFATFSAYRWAAVSGVASLAVILVWLWTGTAVIPEKPHKAIGFGLIVPLYVSGRDSVGWWAMGITMLAVFTAFLSVVFGYVFYWTLDPGFLTQAGQHDHSTVVRAGGLIAVSWLLTLSARRWNAAERATPFYLAAFVGAASGGLGVALLLQEVVAPDVPPAAHVYGATAALLTVWCAVQVGLGVVMQLYCVARRMAGRMTARHDIDIGNTTLYWHFTAATVGVTIGLLTGGQAMG